MMHKNHIENQRYSMFRLLQSVLLHKDVGRSYSG